MRIAAVAVPVLVLAASVPSSQTPLLSPAPASPLHVGRGSGTILIADVNGDARVDLLTHHSLKGVVAVQLGDGRGGFYASAAGPIELPYQSAGIAPGDLDGDGRLDLAVTASDRDVVDILVGTGTGRFRRLPPSSFVVSTAREPFNKRTIRLEDINEDGHVDVVTANGRRRNTFEVTFRDGRGGLSRGPSVRLDSGCDGYEFALGDVNGDGHLDAVSACRPLDAPERGGRLTVLFGNGAGAFMATPQSPVPVRAGARSIAIADLNADRRPDIVVLHATGLVTMLLNEGGGRFSPARAAAAHVGGDAYALRVADLNGDRKLDLVAAAVDRVVVLVGTESGFAPADGSPFAAGPGTYNVVVGDVNGDGRPDLAASSFEGDAITLLLGRR